MVGQYLRGSCHDNGHINLSKAKGGDLLLHEAPSERRVGNPDTLEVKIRVGIFEEEVRDVGYICSIASALSLLASHQDNSQYPAYYPTHTYQHEGH